MSETLARLFRQTISYDSPSAILTKADGKYGPISAQELLRRVCRLQFALLGMGLERGSPCALLSENRWEWAVSDFAMMTAGIVSVPIYPTLPAEQIQYLLEHAEARVILLSSAEQLKKIVKIRPNLPLLERVVAFDADAVPDVSSDADERIHSLDDLIGGEALTDEERERFEAAVSAVEPSDMASIIYTSGTMGVPKGVMLSHGNFATNVRDAPIDVGEQDTALSFLPLSHVAERIADYIYFASGSTVAYAESLETVPQNMQEVRPTVAVGVPRFFEKVHARVMAAMEQAPALRRKLFEWAVSVGKEAAPAKLAGKPVGGLLGLKLALADKLVLQKLRGRLGGRMRLFVSGAAPLARHLAEFFYAVGLPICEAYGLTETSPVVSANTLDRLKFGTVGPVIPNVEVKIAEDGEILVRGPNVMQGYYKMEAQTAEVMSEDWFHTGDIGNLDDEGYLSITDRKKDLLKTSGGKYIAPAPIENRLKMSPFIAAAVVIAEQRNFPGALIVPDFEKLRGWAQAEGLAFADDAALAREPKAQERIMQEVEALCADLARYEQVKKIAVLEREFTIDGGEITPTMKVRRRAVESLYKEQIESMYA